tara:strand:- start:388 stop:870 length:483 start_codon:yes stop_codon:yes gene_type:complete
LAKLRIRRAKFEELDKIAPILLDTFLGEINDNIKELESPDDVSYNKFHNYYLDKALNNIPFVIYVAEIDDEIIGVASGSVEEHHWTNYMWGTEDVWFVKKEHRRGKAGIKLFDKLMEWFKSNKAQRIQMTHYTWNPGIKDFYDKQGFKPYEICYVYKVGE